MKIYSVCTYVGVQLAIWKPWPTENSKHNRYLLTSLATWEWFIPHASLHAISVGRWYQSTTKTSKRIRSAFLEESFVCTRPHPYC